MKLVRLPLLVTFLAATALLQACGEQPGRKDCYPNNGGCIGPQAGQQDPPDPQG
jgi:hypothetical protein